jgi:hypothetical protein
MAEKRQRYMAVAEAIRRDVDFSLYDDPVGVFDLFHLRTIASELVGAMWQAVKTDEGRAIIGRGQLPAKIEALVPEIQAKWVGRGMDAKLVAKVLGVAREKFVQLLRQEPDWFVSSDESTARLPVTP